MDNIRGIFYLAKIQKKIKLTKKTAIKYIVDNYYKKVIIDSRFFCIFAL